VFEVTVPLQDAKDPVAASHCWYDEFFRIVQPPYNCTLGFSLRRVS
jgi:hypothetical protein